MPYKFNADRRDKISKQKFKVTNWPAYNESLRQRGDLSLWVSDEALALWTAPRRTSRGDQPKYSDLAITLCLTLRVVYGLPLRQTQGLMRSVAALIDNQKTEAKIGVHVLNRMTELGRPEFRRVA